jgi:hypothetical protein
VLQEIPYIKWFFAWQVTADMFVTGVFQHDIEWISLGDGALKGYLSIFGANFVSEHLANSSLLMKYHMCAGVRLCIRVGARVGT